MLSWDLLLNLSGIHRSLTISGSKKIEVMQFQFIANSGTGTTSKICISGNLRLEQSNSNPHSTFKAISQVCEKKLFKSPLVYLMLS